MASVKICGLTRESDIEEAIKAGADRVGFVLVPTSPRAISPEQLSILANRTYHRRLGGWAQVWVVADWSAANRSPADKLDALINELNEVHTVQLHGGETPEDVADFRRRVPRVKVVKALGVATAEDLAQVDAYRAADAFLLDAKPPKGADRQGGFGASFDWSILQGFNPGKPWVLSGGLTPENVEEAIRISGAVAVDVSSGVEASPGVKDPEKVRAFVKAAKRVV
jgi:phosphoribosylanthranilate isomerase